MEIPITIVEMNVLYLAMQKDREILLPYQGKEKEAYLTVRRMVSTSEPIRTEDDYMGLEYDATKNNLEASPYRLHLTTMLEYQVLFSFLQICLSSPPDMDSWFSGKVASAAFHALQERLMGIALPLAVEEADTAQ
jgi:hypothetical protein